MVEMVSTTFIVLFCYAEGRGELHGLPSARRMVGKQITAKQKTQFGSSGERRG